MSTNKLLANLLLAASMGLGTASQAAHASPCIPAKEQAPAFAIDADGVLNVADADGNDGRSTNLDYRCNNCRC